MLRSLVGSEMCIRDRVLLEQGVQDGVADGVSDLVGMTLGDGLGGEETPGHAAPRASGKEGKRHARWSNTGAVIKPFYRTPLLASRAIGQPGDDEIPHHVGEGLLRAVGYGRLAAVRAQDHRRVVGHLETAAVPDLVDDQQITALASQLGPAVGQHATTVVPGLGGKAHAVSYTHLT